MLFSLECGQPVRSSRIVKGYWYMNAIIHVEDMYNLDARGYFGKIFIGEKSCDMMSKSSLEWLWGQAMRRHPVLIHGRLASSSRTNSTAEGLSFPGFWYLFHNHTWWFNMKLICVWHISFMNWVFFGIEYKLQFEIAWALIFEHVVFWVCYCHIVRNKVKVLRKLKFSFF